MADATTAIDFYHRSAAVVAPYYDGVEFDDVHPGLAAFLPLPPARILDVGAGTGRDAAALMMLGHELVAVEPAAAMRALGMAGAPGAHWLDDRLPGLVSLPQSGAFDFILCSAVLMSVPPAALAQSLHRMASLLHSGGRISLSVRDPRDGEPMLHLHSDDDIALAVSRTGLELISRTTAPDALRRGLLWRHYLFVAGSAGSPESDDRNRSR